MASRRRASREPEVDPFYDMLFNMLIAFVFCFIVALLAMNPKALKAGDIPSKAEYIITLTWPDNDPNDIDLWTQGPTGEVVYFRNRDAGLMHLDRDDRGTATNTIVVNGRKVVNPVRQEVVTVRGIVAGDYVVNVHYYEAKDPDGGVLKDGGHAVPATLSVVKVNPRAEVVYYGQYTLQHQGEEHTLVRFTVAPDGSVGGFNTLPKKLVENI